MLPVETKAESSPKPKHGNTTHGLTVLKKAVKELGTQAIDGRTTLAKELAEECRELVNALDGLLSD